MTSLNQLAINGLEIKGKQMKEVVDMIIGEEVRHAAVD